jgi:hypothetical protein
MDILVGTLVDILAEEQLASTLYRNPSQMILLSPRFVSTSTTSILFSVVITNEYVHVLTCMNMYVLESNRKAESNR